MIKRITSAAISLMVSLSAFADIWTINLDVPENADQVDAIIGYSEYSSNHVTLVNGLNSLEVGSWNSLFLKPKSEDYSLTLKCNDTPAEDFSKDGNLFELANYDDRPLRSSFTLQVSSLAGYRDKQVNINMDDCSKVKIVRGDNTEFSPEANSFSIPYNSDNESLLVVKPSSYRYQIYKVTADGADVPNTSGQYNINLKKEDGSFVNDINITTEFPQGFTYDVNVMLDGPAAMIEAVKVDYEPLEGWQDALASGVFKLNPGQSIQFNLSNDYKIDKVTDNGEVKSAFSSFSISSINCNHDVTISGKAYANFPVKFNITGAEGIVASLGSTKLQFEDGENIREFNEKNNYLSVYPVDEYTFATFTDKDGKDLLDSDDWSSLNKVFLQVAEGDEYTIVCEKIRRDNHIVVYFNDYVSKGIELTNFRVKFNDWDKNFAETVKPGYNHINFRDEDGLFKIYAFGDYGTLEIYKNGENISGGNQYIEDENVAHADIYKVFIDETAERYDVNFSIASNVMDLVEINCDHMRRLESPAAVQAVGPTLFEIKPAADCDRTLTVKVDGTDVPLTDGAYSFTTTKAADVEIAEDKYDAIAVAEAQEVSVVDVYNLQGIKVASGKMRECTMRLPAGMYIVAGKKIIVR